MYFMHHYLKKRQIEAVLFSNSYFEGCPRVSSFYLNNLNYEVILDVIHTTANWINSIVKIVPKLVFSNVPKTLWNLIPLGLWQMKIEFEDGYINFKILFLKAEKVLEFLFSNLSHSIQWQVIEKKNS